MKKRKNIVVIGGGTGTFTVLSGLKKYPVSLTAIVSMVDDGGSTGTLRDELGVLPPGDVRQCIVALSASDKLMRDLMNYRFERGSLKGHSFGNLLLSALEKTTGSFESAIEKASDILRTRGRVIPATLDKVMLMAKIGKRVVRGEQALRTTKLNGSIQLTLQPQARANPKALVAIREADALVIGPGSLYASIIPDLLVRGLSEAIVKSKAKKIFISNLMSHEAPTKNFSVLDYARTLEKYLGAPADVVIYNNAKPGRTLLKRYARKGDTPTRWHALPENSKTIGKDLISRHLPKLQKSDRIRSQRSFIRHDPNRLAQTILKAINGKAR